jgi:hypothetical protein
MRVSVLLLVVSLLGALVGAWLIGLWAVGCVVLAYSVGLGVFAVLRDVPQPATPDVFGTVEGVLDRARRAS